MLVPCCHPVRRVNTPAIHLGRQILTMRDNDRPARPIERLCVVAEVTIAANPPGLDTPPPRSNPTMGDIGQENRADLIGNAAVRVPIRGSGSLL